MSTEKNIYFLLSFILEVGQKIGIQIENHLDIHVAPASLAADNLNGWM